MDSAFQDRLEEQVEYHADTLRILITDHMREFQKDTSRQLEQELARVRQENEKLRARLCSETGGAGIPDLYATTTNGNAWSQPKAPDSNAPCMELSDNQKDGEHDEDKTEDALKEENPDLPMAHAISASGKRRSIVAESRAHVHAEPRAVFADAASMKEKVREAVTRREYNVCDFYFDEGWPQKIARTQWFEYLTLFVIAVNAIWISVDADLNTSPTVLGADPVFQVAEHTFCFYFTGEIIIRFLAFKEKRNCLKDGWFIFDSLLVTMMVLETWVMTLILLATGAGSDTGMGNTSILKLVRLCRLTRMARMAKLLRAIPELIILIKGIVVASRSVCFTLVLLMLLIYFFAIVFRQLADDTDVGAEYFKSVPDAMISLLLDGVLPDQSSVVRACADQHPFFGIIILLFILLASLTVMNMLVGVLCEVVSVVSSVEKEQLTVNYVKQRLYTMFEEWDEDGSMTISKAEFQRMLVIPEAAKIIHEIGVDVVGLVDFADFIFKEGADLSFADFMELVLSFRGSNQSTVKDVVDLRKFVGSQLETTTRELNDQLKGLTKVITKDVGQVRTALQRATMSNSNVFQEDYNWPAPGPGPAPARAVRSRPSPVETGQQEDQYAVTAVQEIGNGDLIMMPRKAQPAGGATDKRIEDRRPGSEDSTRPGSGVPSIRDNSRPGSSNRQAAGGRPTSSGQSNRPGSSHSQQAQQQAIQSLRQQRSGNALRPKSPALPDYPQNLWIGEDLGRDEQPTNANNMSKNNLRVSPSRVKNTFD